MAKARKLIHKLIRLKNSFGPKDDKIDLKQEILSDSKKAFDYSKSLQRKFDRAFGQQFLVGKNVLEIDAVGTLERVDFGVLDFGLKLTTNDLVVGQLVNKDTIFIREKSSQKAGKKLAIVSIESSTEIRLKDDSNFSGTEVVSFKAQLSTVPAT